MLVLTDCLISLERLIFGWRDTRLLHDLHILELVPRFGGELRRLMNFRRGLLHRPEALFDALFELYSTLAVNVGHRFVLLQ